MVRWLLSFVMLTCLVPTVVAKEKTPEASMVSFAQGLEGVQKDLATALALLQGKDPSKKQVEAAIELVQGAVAELAKIQAKVAAWKPQDTSPRPECAPCAKCEPCGKCAPVPKCEPSGKQNCPPCAPCERCDKMDKKGKNKDKCGTCPPCGRCEPCDGDRDHGHKKGHHGKDDEVPPPEVVPPMPMEAGAFQKLVDQINSEGFEDGKLNVLSMAAGFAWFTVAQVKVVLDQYPFSSGKLSALRLLAGKIVDPQNSFTIFDAFAFDSDKKAAKEILSGGN